VPPASLRRDWTKIVSYREALAAALVKLGRAAKVGDFAAIKVLGAQKGRLYQALSELAKRDGVVTCGRTGKSTGGSATPSPPSVQPAKHS
jgi:hypothetical protein